MQNMNDKQRECWLKYMEGLTYKQIAEETGISIHTLKSYQKKFKWKRDFGVSEDGRNTTSKGTNTLHKFEMIRGGLLGQLEEKGKKDAHLIDLVEDYMELWSIKNNLIADIKTRGVQVPYKNGSNQFGMKRNDSVGDFIKYNAQMLSLLEKLGLKDEEIGDNDVEL